MAFYTIKSLQNLNDNYQKFIYMLYTVKYKRMYNTHVSVLSLQCLSRSRAVI